MTSTPHPRFADRAARIRAARPDLVGLVVDDSPMPDVDDLVARTLSLLESGVPLSLLLDLVDPDGPRSHELLTGEVASTDWLTPFGGRLPQAG